MKKRLLLGVTALCFSCILMAQPPHPYREGETPETTPGMALNPENVPLSPATLLLLGVAGAFTGVKIYRNNKKESND